MKGYFTVTPGASRWRLPSWFTVAMCAAIGLWLAFTVGRGVSVTAQGGGGEYDQRYVAPTKPKVRLNRMIERLEQGYAVFVGVDFQWVDQEHGALDIPGLRKTLSEMLNKRNDKGQPILTPLVRIAPEGENIAQASWIIKQTLESGPFGLIVPGVSTAEQVRAIVREVRYRQPKGSKLYSPVGNRGHGCGVNCGDRTWGLRFDEYVRRADVWPYNPDGEMIVMPMIESAEGVKNVNEILDVPGLSILMIGPSDLSMDMTGKGFRAWWWPNNEQPAEVENAIQTVARACRAKNKICGMAAQTGQGRAADEARALKLIHDGFRLIIQAPMPRQPCTKKAPECY